MTESPAAQREVAPQKEIARSLYGAQKNDDGSFEIPYQKGYNFKRIAREVSFAIRQVMEEEREGQKEVPKVEIWVHATKIREGRYERKKDREIAEDGTQWTIDKVMQPIKNSLSRIEEGVIVIQKMPKQDLVASPTAVYDSPRVSQQSEASNSPWNVSVPASWRPAFAAILGALSTIGKLIEFRPRK